MFPFPYPRSYIDCEVPLLPDGTRLERTGSQLRNNSIGSQLNMKSERKCFRQASTTPIFLTDRS